MPFYSQIDWMEQGTEHHIKAAGDLVTVLVPYANTPRNVIMKTLFFFFFHGVNSPEQSIHFTDHKALLCMDMPFSYTDATGSVLVQMTHELPIFSLC